MNSVEFFQTRWREVVIAVESAVLAVVIYQGATGGTDRPPVGVAVAARPEPVLSRETKADTPIASGTVKTYAPEAKQKLRLPDAVQANQDERVIEASRVPADDHPQTVATVIDTRTGATETYVVRDAMPLLALDTAGDAGLYYGWRGGVRAFRLEARQSLFGVKGVRFGAIGSLDQPVGGQGAPSTFVGVGAWVRW